MSNVSDLFRFVMASLESKIGGALKVYRSDCVIPEDKVHILMTIEDIILVRRAITCLQENIRSDDIKEIIGQIVWEKAKKSAGRDFVATPIVTGRDSASSRIQRQCIPLSQDAYDFLTLTDRTAEKNEVDNEGNLSESENI
jgi:hypothetical protein